jgi:ergothioneine biosynthesis protein EgtB
VKQKTSKAPEAFAPGGAELSERFVSLRQTTMALCEPLEVEDFVVQSMPDASPTKWHLAHSSWFFETFVLKPFNPNHQPFDASFDFIFNSYYNAVGDRHERNKRGLLSRPTLNEVLRYRQQVTESVVDLINSSGDQSELTAMIELGINHEQQHQELILSDLKHLFSLNPLRPAYVSKKCETVGQPPPLQWMGFDEGLYSVGYAGGSFHYDNEGPRHRHFLNSFKLASRLITNEEYLRFVADKGYERSELWLSDGWDWIKSNVLRRPLYWQQEGPSEFTFFTLNGMQSLEGSAPVCHISFYEADAFATWAGARLPTEFEWEVASECATLTGNFVEGKLFRPTKAQETNGPAALLQMFGDAWEWTRSPYSPYPGYVPPQGAIGEYNGKFMCNQFVLRGGSCVSPKDHIRKTYRNFFPPSARWQFSGIRLAKDNA